MNGQEDDQYFRTLGMGSIVEMIQGDIYGRGKVLVDCDVEVAI